VLDLKPSQHIPHLLSDRGQFIICPYIHFHHMMINAVLLVLKNLQMVQISSTHHPIEVEDDLNKGSLGIVTQVLNPTR
jgi:hypothetical protein